MIEKLGENHRSMRKANLNNIPIKEDKMLELIEALRSIFEWLKSSIMFIFKSRRAPALVNPVHNSHRAAFYSEVLGAGRAKLGIFGRFF